MSERPNYNTIRSMNLNHLPNNAKLLLQRQIGGKIPKDDIQFGLPTTFINPDNNEEVWTNGPSIQLEQIPEFMEILQQTYEKYSGKKIESKAKKTATFADLIDDSER